MQRPASARRTQLRLRLGTVTLLLPLACLAWVMVASCSLDWTLHPVDDAGIDNWIPDPTDAPEDPPVDQGSSDADGLDAPDEPDVVVDADGPDAIEPDAPVPCEQQPDCGACVTCVLDELAGVGGTLECLLYDGCVLRCGIDLECQFKCTQWFPVGFHVQSQLNERCSAQCGFPVPCAPPT